MACAKDKKNVIWCDAIATVIEIEGKIVEDASWLRKKNYFSHINAIELESLLKGVNLTLKCGL